MPSPTLRLGSVDADAQLTERASCTAPYHDWSEKPGQFRGEPNNVWRSLRRVENSPVSRLQAHMKDLGFNPHGPVDGVFGYRTQSAARLFQEYVRTIGGNEDIGKADGVVGKKTWSEIDRWRRDGIKAEWTPVDDMQAAIFGGLEALREHFVNSPPDPATRALNANTSPSATRRPADWRFDPADTHLIGIRRDDTRIVLENGKFVRSNDDLFVLLVNGIRSVFRGSTDPSPKMAERDDAAFLVRGQHEYRFGWHKLSTLNQEVVRVYRAFKPKDSAGVLIARAKGGQLTAASYAEGLEPNNTINIHWSGAGTSNWSAGCQVIAGLKYKNFRNEIIDLSSSASASYAGLGAGTRGAYNVLVDLATVFAEKIRCSGGDTLFYTLLYESDLEHAPGSAGIDFKQLMADLS